MEQVAKSEPLDEGKRANGNQPLVFLDTSVILGYVQGKPSEVQLFSAEDNGEIRFAINPIVLQELICFAAGTTQDGRSAARPVFERIQKRGRMLPVDLARAEELLPRARALRNRIVHSNDILIVSSAEECDFLVTKNENLESLTTAGKPQIVTPEELIRHLRSA